ncbi:hypothetical protein HZS_7912 [Henneguya salminicola]|nr:hypothetical protein HZS_7912 [Henneguya salminicola]
MCKIPLFVFTLVLSLRKIVINGQENLTLTNISETVDNRKKTEDILDSLLITLNDLRYKNLTQKYGYAITNQPSYEYLNTYEIKRGAYQAVYYFLYALYELQDSSGNKSYATVLFWRPTDTVSDKQPPELIKVKEIDPLKNKVDFVQIHL